MKSSTATYSIYVRSADKSFRTKALKRSAVEDVCVGDSVRHVSIELSSTKARHGSMEGSFGGNIFWTQNAKKATHRFQGIAFMQF